MAPTATATSPTDFAPRPTKVAKTAAAQTSKPPIIDLYSGSAASSKSEADALRSEIIKGLQGHQTLIVPGSTKQPEDLQFVYSKTLPTTILYDEAGLKIYDRLVEVPEYYLWNAETSLLQKHGQEIAWRLFGHQTPATRELLEAAQGQDVYQRQQRKQRHGDWDQDDTSKQDEPVFDGLRHDDFVSAKEKWGDAKVGRFNGGVNSEHGLDGERAVGQAASSLVELGAGSLRKTIHLLRALEALPAQRKQQDSERSSMQYYALDLDKSELERTLHELRSQLATGPNQDRSQPQQQSNQDWSILDGKVGINGMWATYDQGLDFIGKGGPDKGQGSGRRCLLWLGSSIGNFERRDGAEFLKRTAEDALRAGDTMLIGIDRRNNARDVELAYNDPKGVTTEFIMNGLKHADRVLGGGVIDADKFEYHDRYNSVEGRHESYYRSLEAQTLNLPDGSSVELEQGELIHVERSYKYSERETLDAFDHAGLRVVQKWTSEGTDANGVGPKYDLWLVEKPPFFFRSTRLFTGWRSEVASGLTIAEAHNCNGSHEYDADGGASALSIGEQPRQHALWGSWGLPTPSEWDQVWKSWDSITLTMISRKMLHQKPIDLRHICLFYLGHIPAFVDIMLLKALPDLKPLSEHYNTIFERGIDPHVDDPTQCHAHSEVPQTEEDWPKVEEILAYRERIMQRVDGLYADFASGERVLDRRLARALRMVMEHVELHQETLLYMLAQSPDTLPPAGFSTPDWASLARQWDAEDLAQGGAAAREALLNFKADAVTLGQDDDDDAQDFDYRAAKPTSDIRALNAQLGDPHFGWDNEQPARRVETEAYSITAAPVNNEQYLAFLRELSAGGDDPLGEGLVPASWIASPRQAQAQNDVFSAESWNVRTVYGPVPMSVAHLWPVQGSGTQLRRFAAHKGGRLPTQAELRRFLDAATSPHCVDRPGSNIGFRNWHPVPAALPRREGEGDARAGAGTGAGNGSSPSFALTLPGHNGGVWEWTCTSFDAYEGFRPSALYPGYSADFHDGKHDVVLGGSWATTPSVAGRRTVCNTYQREYPYSFIGGRVVYDQQTARKGGRSARSPSASGGGGGGGSKQ